METAVIVLAGLGTLTALFGAMIRSKHPYGALWIGGLAAVFYVAGICAAVHAKWKQQEAATDSSGQSLLDQRTEERRARVWFVKMTPTRPVAEWRNGNPIVVDLMLSNSGFNPGKVFERNVLGITAHPRMKLLDKLSVLDDIFARRHWMLVPPNSPFEWRDEIFDSPSPVLFGALFDEQGKIHKLSAEEARDLLAKPLNVGIDDPAMLDIKKIQSGELDLFVLAFLRYRDTDDSVHSVRGCWKYNWRTESFEASGPYNAEY